MPGGHSGEVIPVPIPNTEVKLSHADDTAEKWESRKLPGFFFPKKKPAQAPHAGNDVLKSGHLQRVRRSLKLIAT